MLLFFQTPNNSNLTAPWVFQLPQRCCSHPMEEDVDALWEAVAEPLNRARGQSYGRRCRVCPQCQPLLESAAGAKWKRFAMCPHRWKERAYGVGKMKKTKKEKTLSSRDVNKKVIFYFYFLLSKEFSAQGMLFFCWTWARLERWASNAASNMYQFLECQESIPFLINQCINQPLL